MTSWAQNAFFYHIYPLGFCGAPRMNDFSSAPVPRLHQIVDWLDHISSLGANALYLGPVFEASAHGYDTADYYTVDRRLGDGALLAEVVAQAHGRGMRVILDAVFNHVGRDFWAFRDLLEQGQRSRYTGWFAGLDFHKASPYGDPFAYEGWNGHYDLVKLNLAVPEVREHLFGAVETWFHVYGVDGLRLDATDCLETSFLRALAEHCRAVRPDCWLLGEVVLGDYRRFAAPGLLDSVTNYECYKALYSSHVDRNYFELAHALDRQFGEQGLYRSLPLYNFADNHDVNRVATSLREPAHLFPLYCLLMTMPGVPSLYYGSEWGLPGAKRGGDDGPLRPYLPRPPEGAARPQPALPDTIARLAKIRRTTPALYLGDYRTVLVRPEQLAYSRSAEGSSVLVLVNAAASAATLQVPASGETLDDLLNPGERFQVQGGQASVDVPPRWARILRVR
ncbi:MAG: alpha-amylase [Chloroflexi bacterium]|nr:alpha-amylase [Chloroflexota bacterium]